MENEPDIRNAKDLNTMLKKSDMDVMEKKLAEKWKYFKALCEEQDSVMATFWESVALLEENLDFHFGLLLEDFIREAEIGFTSVDNISTEEQTCSGDFVRRVSD